jgi:uncharacterized alpha-E superfamily protein
MLSRIADSLFWMNRYYERTDSIARVTYVNYILSLDRSSYRSNSWRPVLELYTGFLPEKLTALEHDLPAALFALLLDPANENSIISLVRKARENARGAQDHITKEVWEVINELYHFTQLKDLPQQLTTNDAVKVIEAFEEASVLYEGTADNTMPRGLGWNFMRLGRYLERCLQTIAIIRSEMKCRGNTVENSDILQWRQLLLSLSGYEMHLKSYRSQNQFVGMLHQVLLNEQFTRSILYSLIRVKHYLENIMAIHDVPNDQLSRSFGRLLSRVQYLDIEAIDSAGLDPFLQSIQSDVVSLCSQITIHYFSYS